MRLASLKTNKQLTIFLSILSYFSDLPKNYFEIDVYVLVLVPFLVLIHHDIFSVFWLRS